MMPGDVVILGHLVVSAGILRDAIDLALRLATTPPVHGVMTLHEARVHFESASCSTSSASARLRHHPASWGSCATSSGRSAREQGRAGH